MPSLNLLNAFTNNSKGCVKQILRGLVHIFTSIHSCSCWFVCLGCFLMSFNDMFNTGNLFQKYDEGKKNGW